MGLAKVCSVIVRIIAALVLLILGCAFFFQWNNPKHSILISNPKGNDMAPNFRGAKGEYFLNKENLWIHHTTYLPKGDATAAKGLLTMIHGYDTHSGLFAQAAQQIADATNLIVVTWDHQGTCSALFANNVGWGLSEGDRLYFESIASIRDDFVQLLQDKKKEFNITNNVFCFGHSMSGGLMVWEHLNRLQNGQPQLCQGLILSAPAVTMDPIALSLLNGFVGDAINALSEIFPKMILFPKFIFASAVSTIPEFQDQWNADPLVHAFARARPVASIFQIAKETITNRSKINIPYFLFVGTTDLMLPVPQMQEFLEGTASKDKTLKVYDGDAHSVLNDKHSQDAIQDISNWLNKRIK